MEEPFEAGENAGLPAPGLAGLPPVGATVIVDEKREVISATARQATS